MKWKRDPQTYKVDRSQTAKNGLCEMHVVRNRKKRKYSWYWSIYFPNRAQAHGRAANENMVKALVGMQSFMFNVWYGKRVTLKEMRKKLSQKKSV